MCSCDEGCNTLSERPRQAGVASLHQDSEHAGAGVRCVEGTQYAPLDRTIHQDETMSYRPLRKYASTAALLVAAVTLVGCDSSPSEPEVRSYFAPEAVPQMSMIISHDRVAAGDIVTLSLRLDRDHRGDALRAHVAWDAGRFERLSPAGSAEIISEQDQYGEATVRLGADGGDLMFRALVDGDTSGFRALAGGGGSDGDEWEESVW